MQPAHSYRILIVDDDAALAASLASQLTLHGEFAPTLTGSAAQAMTRLDRESFDLILLDVGLPDGDGRDFCRILRRRGVRVPIIMLTGATSDADAILGLNAGATDYIAKPFRLPVLMARLRAQLRQYALSDAANFAVGDYAFRIDSRRLTSRDGKRKIVLTPKEAQILKRLCRSRGEVVARDELLRGIWGDAGYDKRHSLEAHIYRLRQKIGGGGEEKPVLVTESTGYRLV